METVPIADPSYKNIMRLTATQRSEQPYMIQAIGKTAGRIESGDAVLLKLTARCAQPLARSRVWQDVRHDADGRPAMGWIWREREGRQ